MSAGNTRREALAAFATAAAAVAAPAAAALPRPADRRAWDAAWAAFKRSEAEADRRYQLAEVANKAFYGARQKLAHVTVQVGSSPAMSTADDWAVRLARTANDRLGYLEDVGGNFDRYRAYHQLVQADDAREAEIERLDAKYGWTRLNDAYDKAADAMIEAERVLLDMPAPDGETLLWKVQRLFSPEDSLYSEGKIAQTHADLRRFLLGGGH